MAEFLKQLHAVAPPPQAPKGKEYLAWGSGTFGSDDDPNQFQAWKAAIIADSISHSDQQIHKGLTTAAANNITSTANKKAFYYLAPFTQSGQMRQVYCSMSHLHNGYELLNRLERKYQPLENSKSQFEIAKRYLKNPIGTDLNQEKHCGLLQETFEIYQANRTEQDPPMEQATIVHKLLHPSADDNQSVMMPYMTDTQLEHLHQKFTNADGSVKHETTIEQMFDAAKAYSRRHKRVHSATDYQPQRTGPQTHTVTDMVPKSSRPSSPTKVNAVDTRSTKKNRSESDNRICKLHLTQTGCSDKQCQFNHPDISHIPCRQHAQGTCTRQHCKFDHTYVQHNTTNKRTENPRIKTTKGRQYPSNPRPIQSQICYKFLRSSCFGPCQRIHDNMLRQALSEHTKEAMRRAAQKYQRQHKTETANTTDVHMPAHEVNEQTMEDAMLALQSFISDDEDIDGIRTPTFH
jgi:hypothetical protein